MMQLVISVRDPEEAVLAAAHGADLVDLKEPRRGAMGRAEPETAVRIRGAIPSARLSLAMGELSDHASCRFDWSAIRGYQFAKAAPAGCPKISDWRRLWGRWRENLPADVRPVVVVYADAHLAESPAVDELMRAAVCLDVAGVLLDTFVKSGASVLAHATVEEIRGWASQVRADRKWFALAGSLRLADIAAVRLCTPDYLAFRTAACAGGRMNMLSAEHIQRLRHAIDAPPHMG